jgi:hypothetical protein
MMHLHNLISVDIYNLGPEMGPYAQMEPKMSLLTSEMPGLVTGDKVII